MRKKNQLLRVLSNRDVLNAVGRFIDGLPANKRAAWRVGYVVALVGAAALEL